MGLAAATLALLPSVALPAAAQARWTAPFQFAKPGVLDVVPPVVAVSASGASAAAFGLQDVDSPGSSQAYVTLRGAHAGAPAPILIPGAQQILAAAYVGGGWELLTGAASATDTCCSTVQAVQVTGGGRVAGAHSLVGGLGGATQGRLLTLKNGQVLAAVATERGVWVVQSSRPGRFAAPHRLTRGGQMPETLAAAWLGAENTIVAWTTANGIAGVAAPRSITYAVGSRTRAPHRVKTAVTVRPGHRIDELGVAARAGGGATAAWIESWYDDRRAYHSRVRAMDVAPHAAVRYLSPANRLASGLDVAGDVDGDQAVAWRSCTPQAACQSQVATRPANAPYGAPRTLGLIDPSQAPALAVGSRAQVLVGWVRGGRPVAATAAGVGRTFGRPVTLSRTTFALDLTVGYGPGRRAVVAWTQGTLNPSVVGAAYTG
ncbi:MAG: hypothetical protein ACJ780_13895 [Solirubrobacteraceae bacterium]